ncbi:MAG: energy transducer TonB [Candidatus Binatia bacterium]
MASFFFVSMALHAAALAYPVLLLELRTAIPIMVTVLEAEEGSGGGTKGEGAKAERKPVLPARKSMSLKQQPPVAEPEQVSEPPKANSTPAIVAEASGAIAISANQHEEFHPVEGFALSSGIGSSGSGLNESPGSGSGLGGTGGGVGDGRGSGNGGLPSVQVTRAYSPDPQYPHVAREKGWEGTVTIKVLVDEQGKAKFVEIHQSSGFSVLDEAARETVKKRWRFHPARNGEKPVERWVEFAVVFSLANLKRR